VGKSERRKGTRGEQEAARFWVALGMMVKRVGGTEATRGGARGWDLEVGGTDGTTWNVQVKAVQIWPNVAKVFAEGATLLQVHLTNRGRYIIVHEDDLDLLASDVHRAKRAEA